MVNREKRRLSAKKMLEACTQQRPIFLWKGIVASLVSSSQRELAIYFKPLNHYYLFLDSLINFVLQNTLFTT